jgi:hypothetical protein
MAYNNFTATGPNAGSIPTGLAATSELWDYKNSFYFKSGITLSNDTQRVTKATIRITNDAVSKIYNALNVISETDNIRNKILELNFLDSPASVDGIKDNTIEYEFLDLVDYKIFYTYEITDVVNSVNIKYTLSFNHNYIHYENPVKFTDFTFTRGGSNDDHVQNGDNLEISGLLLDHGNNKDSNNIILDTTIPENEIIEDGITIYAIYFTIEEDVVSYDDVEYIESIYYEMDYNPAGNYTLEDIQLTTGKKYNISVNGIWKLGHSVDKTSTQQLSVLNRPNVAAVDIKSLHVKDVVEESIVDITIDPIVSGSSNVVSKIWFEFYITNNNNAVLVAKAGGTTGITIQTESNIYSLKLSDIAVISNGGLSNTEYYKVRALVKYTSLHERRSSPFPAITTEYKNFTKSIPKIVGHTTHSLYTSNPTENIVTIDVEKQAYELYAPNSVNGIKFHFYDGAALVASTSSYTFVNSSGAGNVSYPIKLSHVTPGVLVNDKDYRIKAEVTLVQHDGTPETRLSELSSATESIPDKINFTKSIPNIVGHTIHSLYISDPTENIATIDVEKQAYFLVAPNVANGIKFHFYDGAALVASTSSYTFVNSTGAGNVSYPIKLSHVTSGVLVNDKDYRIKAEVTLVKHSGATELRTSELSSATESIPDKLNFTKSIPEIVSHTINSLYTINPLEKILDINVKKQAYFLVAPTNSQVIKFHFYDAADTTTIVASTSLYTFVNSSGTGNVSYPILLSEVTPGVLVNDKDYRIKAEVTLVKHDATNEQRFSALSSATESIPDKVNFSLKTPVITSITSYDFQIEEGDNADPVVANIVVRREPYELVAPNSVEAIKFLIYESNETTLVGSTNFYTFQNSSANPSAEYSIKYSDVVIVSGQDILENGTIYKVKAQVTIIKHSGDTELRLSAEFKNLKGSQDTAPLSSVSISNSWALATNDDPSSSSTRFNASPSIGISGFFKKTPQFNGGSTLNHLDITSTKFKIEYQVGQGSWSYVQKAVLLQKSGSESLQEAVSRVNAESVVSSANGQYANVVGSGPGHNQPEMIFFIPQEQVTGINAFTEINQVKIRISIIDPTDMWQSTNGGITEPRESNSTQLINKINSYDFVVGESSEPFNSVNGEGHLFLNIPVDWKSTHAHSVKVGYKYVSGDSYSYQTFTYNPTTTISFEVDPTAGTTLYYSVAYLVSNVNISTTATTQGLTIEKDVSNKLFPSSTDYSITSTSYKTFNTGGKSSITFNLAFTAASTARIDGLNVYFTSPDSTQGSNVDKKRIATFNASQGGNKTIQLLYAGSTINYSHTLNFTPLNTINASGTIVTDLSVIWQDFDLANISFEAYRDRRVTSTGASYGTTNYVESGSSNFDKTIWNVPFMVSPGSNGPITLEGGVRNSSTATKLSWMQVVDPNGIYFTHDFTMMKNDNSTSLIHNDSGLATNQKILTIDADANAKYNITLALVFAPSTTGSMREVSAYPNLIEFHTIHVDVSDIDILVNNPSNRSIVNLSFNDAVVSGNSVTSGATGTASFTNNIVEHNVIYSTTNPTNALTRLAPSSNNVIERIVSPATLKQYTLPVTTPATKYSFFMRLKALIKYNVTKYVGAASSTPSVELLTTDSVEISDQTATSVGSQYLVSSIPIIGSSVTITPHPTEGNTTLNFLLDANGLEEEGFISVVVILAQDGTDTKPDGEAAILLFPDTGTTSDYTNNVAGSGSASLDPRLAGGESFTTTPRTLDGAVMGTNSGEYTLTIGDVNSTTGRYNTSTLKLPLSSVSGFTSGEEMNMFILVTTRRGTNFATRTFTHTPPVVVRNLTISGSLPNLSANFHVGPA